MARESLVSSPFDRVPTLKTTKKDKITSPNFLQFVCLLIEYQPRKQKNDTLQVPIFHTLQEYLSHPLELNEMETIIQKAGSLVKLEEVEFSSP